MWKRAQILLLLPFMNVSRAYIVIPTTVSPNLSFNHYHHHSVQRKDRLGRYSVITANKDNDNNHDIHDIDDNSNIYDSNNNNNSNNNSKRSFSALRRALVVGTVAAHQGLWGPSSHHATAWAAARNPIMFRFLDARQSSLYVVSPERNVTATSQREPLFSEPYNNLSSEICLLKLLPVKNPLLRSLEKSIISLSALETAVTTTTSTTTTTTTTPSLSLSSLEAWKKATVTMQAAVEELDNKRGQLAPVFNPEDSTALAISKGERGERLIENLRRCLVRLIGSTGANNLTQTVAFQKDALLALSEVGELLVAAFPYDVPTEGKFSYLPRLLGRARVTFTFRRKNQILGNVTIVADGFTAPISAGNFVDLSVRNFYTGLPVKFARKRLGGALDGSFEVATLPVLGSFQEGFYDPLTAKPRRIPLEIIRNEKSNGSPNLSYSQGLTELSSIRVVLEPSSASRPLLSFNIPGLVALNHPDQKENGASSEFFALQDDSMTQGKKQLLDGEYAPFGYIIDGYDLFNRLKPGDVVDQTYVDEWSILNLVKIRQSSFSEVVQSSSETSTEN